MIEIRDFHTTDFEITLKINQAEELQTSPLDIERLSFLFDLSCYHKVAILRGNVAGFVLAMDETAPYENDNLKWFAHRYSKFIYVDRIVVAKDFAGMKIGSLLYEDLFEFARLNDVKNVTCEYNIEPPNLASRAFHRKWGFKQVGTQRVANGTKLVSLQAAVV